MSNLREAARKVVEVWTTTEKVEDHDPNCPLCVAIQELEKELEKAPALTSVVPDQVTAEY